MKIYTVGGFSEVGKNMTVVDLGEDAFIFDAGFYLPAIVEVEEREKSYTEKKLRDIGALPDDILLDRLGIRNKVRAILISHAHLDHVGAVPYIAPRYKAEIIGTPFTIEVLKTILNDEKIFIKNKIRALPPNSSYMIKGKNKKYQLDMINITHSTLQMSLLALHTPEGIVMYANDFKIDDNPIVGLKPNYEKLRELAKKGVKVLILDSLYSGDERKTASEKIARAMLEDVMFSTDNKKSGMVITTFSSHIARLKSIVDFGMKLNRDVVLVGRSLNKYVTAAKNVRLCPFANKVKILSYKKQVESGLRKINKNKTKYLVVCTGHQGEPGSVLDRMTHDKLPFQLSKNDHVIFSSKTIPTPINISNRQQLEKRLKMRGVRIFDNVHVSGHAGREDLRDFVSMVKPQHIIPAHGDLSKLTPMTELASEMGYKYGKTVHLMQDSQHIKIN